MDTPYNRRVPLPPKFRRTQKKSLPLGLPKSARKSAGWLLCLAMGVLAWFAARWYNVGTLYSNMKVDLYRSHHSIASDIAEAETIIHHLKDKLLQADIPSTIPSLHTALDQSTDALSAAMSFVACHDQLVLDFAKRGESETVCDALFERVLGCQYQFTKFHEHHKWVVATCEVELVKEVEDRTASIAKPEHQRYMEAAKERGSSFAFWNRRKGAVMSHKNQKGVRDGSDQTRDSQAVELMTALRAFPNQIQKLRLADPIAEVYRRNIQERYGRVLQSFIAVGCGQPGSLCLCENIDMEDTKRLLGNAASEVKHLALRVSKGARRQ